MIFLFLTQYVDFPTHVSGTKPDLVLCSEDNIIMSTESAGTLGSSDHEIVIVNTLLTFEKYNEKATVRNWRKANFEAMNDDINVIDWELTYF